MARRLLGRVIIAGLVGLLGFGVWFALQMYPLGASHKSVLVVVHYGDSMTTIVGTLHREGVLASPTAFEIDLAIFGSPSVRAGDYELPQGDSFSALRSVLAAGPNSVVLSVRPGLTLHELAVTLSQDEGSVYADGFLRAACQAASASQYAPVRSLEGLVGPGEYVIAPHETPAQLLAAMQEGFAREAASVGLNASTRRNGLDAYQLLVGASIVEKEGYYVKNMPDVARVILNRLSRGTPLQMDSTILYALQRDGGRVTPSMLATTSPYNSYLNAGLTPTPICVVSTDALRAMLNPPPGPWLYFVLVSKDGTMAFAATFAEQLANERLAAARGVA